MEQTAGKKVKIIIGSHGSGKSDWLYNRFITNSRKNDGTIDFTKRFVLVVPEQDTAEKQKLLMNRFKDYGYGIFNVDVMSFDRIAHSVFDRLNVKPEEENVIDDAGKTLLLTQIINDLNKEKKLIHYGKSAKNIGFAKKMTKAMSEFYAYNVIKEIDQNTRVDKIEEVIKNLKNENNLMVDKLKDLREIYIAFLNRLSKLNYSIKETKYDLLNKVMLDDREYFENTVFAFEGFTGFTPIQMEIFDKIHSICDETYVVIDYRKEDNKLVIDNNIKYTDVFYLSKKFVLDLKHHDIEFVEYNKDNTVYKYVEKADLALVERNIYNYSKSKTLDYVEPKNIELYEAKNAEDEIINVAHIILKEINNNKQLKYNDIKIVVPNIEDYADKIINIFKKYNIPIFIDNSKSILNSPYIEAIRSALDVVTYNFSYDSVMRYINSGIFAKDKDIYEIDNFIREFGLRGANRYKYGFEPILKKGVKDYDGETLIGARDIYFGPLLDLYYNIKTKPENKTIIEYIEIIEKFIKDVDIDGKFDALVKEIEDGDDFQVNVLNKSIETKNKFFDLIKNVFKDDTEKRTLIDFRNIIDVGFENSEVKTIPHKLDQVVVGDIMRSRFDNPKIQICMGFNQSKVPAETGDNNLIDDLMRDEFKNVGIEISQTTYETALNQRLYLYLILTNPTDKLILSYPRLNINKSSDEKSSVIVMLEKIFYDNDKTTLLTHKVDKYAEGYFNDGDFYNYVAENMQDLRREYDDISNDELKDKNVNVKRVIKHLHNKYGKEFDNKFSQIFNKLNKIEDKSINENLVKDIIDKTRGVEVASATYIESYNSCPYKHFLEHTIGLSQRKNYEISAMDLGTHLHKILELFYKNNDKLQIEKLIREHKLDKEIDNCIDIAIEGNLSFKELKSGKEVFFGNNKLNVIKQMAKRLILAAIKYIAFAGEDSTLETFSTEERFDRKIECDGIDVKLKGTVDKIEGYEDKGNIYINVIDYKSGKNAQTISMKDIEDGKKIQLVLYLDYCKNVKFKDKNVIPCGSFYLWIENPIIELEDESDVTKVKVEVNKKLAYVGIANDDIDTIHNIKNTLEKNKRTKGYIDKDTGFAIKGEVVESFDGVIETVHTVVADSIHKIENGNIDISSDEEDCKYCKYSNICVKGKAYTEEENLNGDNE